MKFGKCLKEHIEQSLPEWRDKFLSYKELKKLLRLIVFVGCDEIKEEFFRLLNVEIDKFNAFLMEQEEEFVIRHKELKERMEEIIQKWGPNGRNFIYKEDMANISNDIVNFHGELVLLLNYSCINYTGLAKILKKFDKRTGGEMRIWFMQGVVEEPFFSTDLISKLAKEWENTIDAGLPPCDSATGILLAGEVTFRSRSSTYSHYSLPPLNLPELEVIRSLKSPWLMSILRNDLDHGSKWLS